MSLVLAELRTDLKESNEKIYNAKRLCLSNSKQTFFSNTSSSNLFCPNIKKDETFQINLTLLNKKFPNILNGILSSILESVSNNLDQATQLIEKNIQSTTDINDKIYHKRNRPDYNTMSLNSLSNMTDNDKILYDKKSQTTPINSNFFHTTDLNFGDHLIRESSTHDNLPLTDSLTSTKNLEHVFYSPDKNINGMNTKLCSMEDICTEISNSHKIDTIDKTQDKTGSEIADKQIQKVLAKVVINQHEKLSSLQQDYMNLELENKILKKELDNTRMEYEKIISNNKVLQYYITAANSCSKNSNAFDINNRSIF